MQQFKNEDAACEWCINDGQILFEQEISPDRIKAGLILAREDFLVAQESVLKQRWNSAYKMHYDVLHQLAEAYLLIERIKARNHLCLFAYLCAKHPELELDWGFLEKIRTKRNGLNYYGTLIQEKDWKEVQLQFHLYIKLFEEKINHFLVK